jgi:hypothetical protein
MPQKSPVAIDDHQIRKAIAVEISSGNVGGVLTVRDRDRCGGRVRIGSHEDDADIVPPDFGEVRDAVAVKVGDHSGTGQGGRVRASAEVKPPGGDQGCGVSMQGVGGASAEDAETRG